jgi:hypothetical protein
MHPLQQATHHGLTLAAAPQINKYNPRSCDDISLATMIEWYISEIKLGFIAVFRDFQLHVHGVRRKHVYSWRLVSL